MSGPNVALAEAHERWCPFYRRSDWSGDGSFTTNRPDGMSARNGFCVGPDCMAWIAVATPEDRPSGEEWGRCAMMPGDASTNDAPDPL